MTQPSIAIVGAGLGGLTAAIALTLKGFSVDVYESTAELKEVGAGLTVSRSAQSVFAELGMMDRVCETASLTYKMAFLHYQSGTMLSGEPDTSDGRWSADKPAGGIHIHRADMHQILAERFAEIAPQRLHLGKRLASFTDASGPISLQFIDGTSAESDMLIGADGVRSAVRQKLWGDGLPQFTGQVAYRFMVPGDVAAPYLKEAGRAAVFLGPGRVFNRYDLRRGDIVNCVGITQAKGWDDDGSWTTPAEVSELLKLYEGWHDDVTGLMSKASPEHLIKWALFARPPLPGWLRGRTTLLGDAAHPMLPFLGLGAAMAIEDAMVLARALELQPNVDGLALYEDLRRPRVDLIADLSRIQGELSQQGDPDNYDPKTAPAQDPSIQAYNPVTTSLIVEPTV